MNIIGKPFRLAEFEAYVEGLKFEAWKPSLVVIHHCAAPSLKQRPNGFQPQHMENLRNYYGNELGWNAAPHIFTDEDQAWVFNPLTKRGTHAVSFNATGWGIEMLGDYDCEDPWSGRGLNVLSLTAEVAAILLKKIGKDATAIRFHRDDPKTKKTCPGMLVEKPRFVAMVAAALG